ncbi:death-associated protein kinase 1-like [Ptychodera flava]|uniref:death-associated protein kinase 1-like n=1 Tax=Ptychodera flava TaxID=63121 RepID=UPI003969BB64
MHYAQRRLKCPQLSPRFRPKMTGGGQTPLDVADDRRLISLLKAAKRKAAMEAKFSVLMKEPGVTRNSSKINVCGFGGVGKTTLLKSLQRGFLEAYFTRRSEERAPPPDKTTHIPTPGIEVNIVNIPKAGKYRAWDFAGQPEYYVTHNMFLRADDSVFLVVFKIMDVIDDFDGTLTEELLTWPRFIKSRISDDQSSENKPTVILVASGADMVETPLHDHAIKIVEDIRAQIQVMFGEYLNIVDETFLLNCHDSRHKDMDRLRKCLSDCKREEQIPKLCAKIADVKNKWQINDKFPIWYWPAYVEQVKKIDPLVEEDFLKRLHLILTTLESKKLRKNQKFDSRSDIDEVFSGFADTELLLNLLKIFELVFEADHSPSVSLSDMLYIAPALLMDDMPESQWAVDPTKQIYFGRRTQCRDETDSFSPGLFPRLEARLYNHFRDLGQTPSGIWKNGIKVCHVVECLVYMTRGWRAIHICVRTKDEETSETATTYWRWCLNRSITF